LPELALASFSLTMVCALYPLCAILLGTFLMAEDAPCGKGAKNQPCVIQPSAALSNPASQRARHFMSTP